jgi:hygromycin-B 4-O-kinase
MPKPCLSLPAVQGFLATTLRDDVTDLAELASGEWSQAFSFVAGDRAQIVRFAAVPDDFRLDRFAARFSGPALPIPRIGRLGEALGCHYAISDRHFGEFLEGGSQAQMERKLPSLFAVLDALREIDTSTTTGFGPWRADGSGTHSSWRGALLAVGRDRPADRIHGWRRKLARVEGAEARFLEGFACLERAVPHGPELRHVIHSDLIHRNVLVHDDRITAVFDWGCAMYGDFLYDLAWLTFWSPWHPELRDIDLRSRALAHYDAIGLAVPDFERRMRCCELHIGLAAQAYNAFTDRWDELVSSGRRTLACGALVD